MRHRHRKRHDRPHLAPVLNARRKKELRDQLRARDGGDCFYCLRALGDDETIEHLEDWAAGGSNELRNLALAHRECNADAKGLGVDDKLLRRGNALLAIAVDSREAA